MRITRLALVVVVAGVGCTTDASVEGPLDPAPAVGGQQLATATVHLAPGQETYWCYQFYSPDESVAITKVDTISMPGVHHMALFQAFGRNEEDAPHECNTLQKDTWNPIFASGTGSPTLTLPAGTGFVILPHTQYIVQLHLQNASDKAIEIRAGANLEYEHDITAVIPAGIYALGTFALSIPPQTLDYQVPIDCHPGKEMHVFAEFPHMHKLGTKLAVERTTMPTAPENFYTIDPWVFGNQPVAQELQTITPSDNLHMTCHYDNRTDSSVNYGESSDNEMCFFIMFYYPYDGLDGCIDG